MKWKKIEKLVSENYWAEKGRHRKSAKIVSIIVSSIYSFVNNQGFNKGATLTFYSLFAIIPVIAISFGIAQKLGLSHMLTEQIKKALYDQPQVADKIIQFSNAALSKTKGSIIAGFGIVLFFWTVFRMIANTESFFDDIWKIKQTRSFLTQLKYYIPLIILFPIFVIGVSSFVIFATTKALVVTDNSKDLETIVYTFSALAPFIFTCIVFTLVFKYLPNTKVPWKPAIIGGIMTAILFQIWQWIYINFQMNASSYGAIYGTFAAIPLFLLWLNYSWLIVLFGTELSYQISKK